MDLRSHDVGGFRVGDPIVNSFSSSSSSVDSIGDSFGGSIPFQNFFIISSVIIDDSFGSLVYIFFGGKVRFFILR